MTEGRFRTLVITLLTLNIFVICALAGAGLTWLSARPVSAPAQQLPLAGENLPAKDRAAFQKALAETRRAERQTRLDGQQAKFDAGSLMGQPTFDQTALLAALAKARASDFAMRQKIEERAVEFAATLSVEDRRLLAEGLIQRMAPKPPAATK